MLYSNFTIKVWYTPLSERDRSRPARFLLKTLPYRFLNNAVLSNVSDLEMDISDYIRKECIIDFENIDIPHGIDKQAILDNLETFVGLDIVQELVQKILELFSPSTEFLSTLVTTIELMVDPRFSDGTWFCPTCQRRGLDRSRNCPYLGNMHFDPMFKLLFMGETVTQCPVDKKDEALGKVLLEGYNFREIHQLPELGGIGDQPILFVLGTQHLAERIKHFQREAEKEAIRKTSHK